MAPEAAAAAEMSSNGSLSVAQLLCDAKRLAGRLRDHDESCNRVVSGAQETLKAVSEMKNYQEDLETLNSIANQRPRPQLVLGIQQENRHIRQLQQENKELRAALEEHQNAIELIMSKYRQHMMCLVNSSKIDQNAVKQSKTRMLQERVDKICEMAAVMNQATRLDDQAQSQEQEVMSRLITENKGLREMLEISHRNGSYSDPLVGPRLATKECQTDIKLFQPPSSTATPGGAGAPPSAPSSSAADAAAAHSNGLPNGVGSAESPGPTKGTSEAAGLATNEKGCCKHCSQSVAPVVSLQPAQAPPTGDRPVSAASAASSTDSEDTTEEEDEVIFNTIKRGSSLCKPTSDTCSSNSELNSTVIVNNKVEVAVTSEEKVNGEARCQVNGGGGGAS